VRRSSFLHGAGSILGALALAGAACASEQTSEAPAVSSGLRASSSLPRPLPASRGATFYVAPTGSDRNPGTATDPWRTIQRAFDRLRPGERAVVRAGTYSEDLVMRRAGTAQAPITVIATAGARVVLRPASRSGDTYAVRFRSGAAYVRFGGFVIENARGTSSTNVYFEGSAHDIELVRNEIRYSQDQGIFSEDSTRDLHIVRNRIHHNGRGHVAGQHQSHGIYIEGRNHLIANNVVHDHPFGFGIQIYPANRGTIVVHNTIVSSALGAIVVGGDEGVGEITIRNNILAFNRGLGVRADSDCPIGPVAVDTNVIYGNTGGAVDRRCGRILASRNVNSDPRFVSRGRRNFQLAPSSPALDRARADFSPRTDLAGRRRPAGRGYDIGAYERRR
jgi:Right handed beta helix region